MTHLSYPPVLETQLHLCALPLLHHLVHQLHLFFQLHQFYHLHLFHLYVLDSPGSRLLLSHRLVLTVRLHLCGHHLPDYLVCLVIRLHLFLLWPQSFPLIQWLRFDPLLQYYQLNQSFPQFRLHQVYHLDQVHPDLLQAQSDQCFLFCLLYPGNQRSLKISNIIE